MKNDVRSDLLIDTCRLSRDEAKYLREFGKG